MKFANRTNSIKKSYVREILKVTECPDVISFAGGLPNPDLFPVNHIMEATSAVLEEDGKKVLQYSTTEGYLPLREYIAKRYYPNTNVTAANIIITNGSQQALDLVAKAFLDKGDYVLVECPGYLGALQAFSVFEVSFKAVRLNSDGIDLIELEKMLAQCTPKIFYTVPNFHNPTGITYSKENRERLAEILRKHHTILIEDNPYGELRFEGETITNMKYFLNEQVISCGSFSKIFSPAMRLGWICASSEIVDILVTLKQASDLHTNYFCQRTLYQYFISNNLDEHIGRIIDFYREKRDYMLDKLRAYMPEEVAFTQPEGGMFIWVTLPSYLSAIELLDNVLKQKVAFVPGNPFYIDEASNPGNTLRLNYTNSSKEEIDIGIKIIAEVIKDLI